jgi:hypothetical protein
VDAVKVPVSRGGGSNPVWSQDGRQLFFVDDDPRELLVAEVTTTEGFGVVAVESLFEIPPEYLVGRLSDFYDVSLDGERFLMARRADGGSAAEPQLILVRNWFEELQARVPTTR